MKISRLEFLFGLLILSLFMGSSWIYGSQKKGKQGKDIELERFKYGCQFVCLKLVRSGTYGVLYEGHETFQLFLLGNVYEDDFETRVLKKADISCKGPNTVKLVDFKTNTFAMADGLGQSQKLTKVVGAKTFSPVKHCSKAPADP